MHIVQKTQIIGNQTECKQGGEVGRDGAEEGEEGEEGLREVGGLGGEP